VENVQSAVSKRAAALFDKGFNCAESLPIAVDDSLGTKGDIVTASN